MAEGLLDHLVIGATSLAAGFDYLKERLGVEIPPGGEHHQMGTHNCLMRLEAGLYIETIAIAPHLAVPPRARWFGLDDPAQQARLAERPRLIHWIARTPSIEAGVAASDTDLGEITNMHRDDLIWRLTIRPDGSLPYDGLLPSIIQWPGDRPHPSVNMAELGIGFTSLTLFHPRPDELRHSLNLLGLDHVVTVKRAAGEPYLEAALDTPTGPVVLD